MIQIEDIQIREFRGIRDLSLHFGSKSFVVWGPNGSGKSGVVDAIDFALTGNIARLSGAGSGLLTVLKHGPHVHHRKDPAVAEVSITVRETTSGTTAVLTRNVKTASKFTLLPDTPQIREAVERAQESPELTLSRRDIIRYIVVEPGKRSDQVQALLKLDQLGSIRSLLKQTLGKLTSAQNETVGRMNSAQEALARHFGVETLAAEEVMNQANKHRRILGLNLIDTLTVQTNLAEDLETYKGGSSFNRESAIRDVRALVSVLENHTEFDDAASGLRDLLNQLEDTPSLGALMKQHDFVRTGIELIVEDECPLCDTKWADVETLRSHLMEKLVQSEEAAKLEQRLRTAAQGLRAAALVIHNLVGPVLLAVRSEGSATLPFELSELVDFLAGLETKLATGEGTRSVYPRLVQGVTIGSADLRRDLCLLIDLLNAKPDSSAENNARTFLTIAQERLVMRRKAWSDRSVAERGVEQATIAYDTFCTVFDEALSNLYKTVENDFSSYYSAINSDDEATFSASLEPSAGKLDLTVAFYGLGMFPPAAYHSEGHQDGMGVCLYLALIKQLLGQDFRLAMLDDVVMSVDVNHRRQFCELLRRVFPDVQFIITTHDEVWARQMQQSGLVTRSGQARFFGWSVDQGPTYESGVDVWKKIQADLDKDDVPSAAARLRRNAESTLNDITASLQGRLVFRRDGRYELGDFLPAVKEQHKKLLESAKKSALSWNNADASAIAMNCDENRKVAVVAQETENWVVNTAIHYNEWANLSRADFATVVAAWRDFFDLFSCASPDCDSLIELIKTGQTNDSLRCACGTYNLNLQVKP